MNTSCLIHIIANCVLFRSSAKAAVILLPVFGLTWVFGLLAVSEDTVVFAWIFTVINSLQVIDLHKITIYSSYELHVHM